MEVTTILTIVVLNILLPTADVFSDINLVVKLYTPQLKGCKYKLNGIYHECEEDPVTFCSKDENREHCIFYEPYPAMATVLLMPFLLNYIVCFYTFFRLTTNRKRYTFIFPLLNLYPQYEAAKLLSWDICMNPMEGKKKKKEFDQNIGLHEVFLESVPTALIITVLFFTAENGRPYRDSLIFPITFFLSVFSASLGLAKCLKNGVARPIGDGGCLDGLLSCKHLLAFFACAACLVARGACLGILTFSLTFSSGHDDGTPSDFLLSIFLLFVPQCLLAIFSTLNLSSKSSLKIITRHPSLLLLPIFTFFTFSKVKVGNVSGVRFRKTFTWVNMAVSVVGYVCWVVWCYHRPSDGPSDRGNLLALIVPLPLLLLSAILTLLLLHLDRLSCCCSWTRVPEEVTSVYDPTTDMRMILENGELVEPHENGLPSLV